MDRTSYSTNEVASLAGCSFRQLDYWSRNGVLEPSIVTAAGAGTRRAYSFADVERARVLASIAPLGAMSSVLAAITARLADDDVSSWPLLMFVLVDGTISDGIVPGVACYVIDVGGLTAAGRGRHRVHSPAA